MDIKRLFTDILKDYDRMNAIISLGLHNYWRASCVKMAQLPIGSKILDIGCGTGDFSCEINKILNPKSINPKFQIFGLDLLEDMLKIAREKCSLNPVVGDCLFLPCKSNSFDGITLGFVLRHLTIQSFLKEAMRVLKPAGRLVILELSYPDNGFIRFFFEFYLKRIVPFLGKIFSTEYAYLYLGESLKYIPKISELEQMVYKEGAKRVTVKRFMFGSIFCLLAVK